MINFQLGYGRGELIVNEAYQDIDNLATTSAQLWINSRNTYNFEKHKVAIKARNLGTQRRLVYLVYSSYLKLPDKEKFNGLILPNESQRQHYEGKGLEFRIGAPLVWLMKLAPNGHFIYNYDYPSNYKQVAPDENLFNNLGQAYIKGYGTKYNHNHVKNNLPDNYILFAHQGLDKVTYYTKMLGIDLLKQVSQWALDNKKHVVIRLHPTADEIYTNQLDILKNNYISFDFNSYIVDLVRKCSQLWTISSACGMEAILMRKPVTIFGKTDYHPVVNNADNIDLAYKDSFSAEDYIQFMTWYSRNLCVNIHHESAEDRIYKRMYDYLILGENIANLY
jgi:hypothetical protein